MTHSNTLPIVGITMGDPVGIGPEILVKALGLSELNTLCHPLIIGDSTILNQIQQLLNIHLNINLITNINQMNFHTNVINILETSALNLDGSTLDGPTIATGLAMEKYILKGIDLAMAGDISSLVTCPITKTALKMAGSKFHGHTEMLASITRSKEYAMMLTGNTLKVVLVTIHIPLSQVSSQLSIQKIVKKIQLTHCSLIQKFNIEKPKIAVAGLNPHSGEDSMFGFEEEKIISPAIKRAKKEGIHVHGPLPPDTVFLKAMQGHYDAVVCMYHDQGLIPFKMIHFKDGVNTTLGLPIIRTSVDHGTAYDIAWKGIADPSSLIEAIKMAAFQANNFSRQSQLQPVQE